MALGDGTAWDETLPSDATSAVSIDDHNRDLRKGVRSRMALEHEWPASQSATSEAGKHKFITMQEQGTAPTVSGTQESALYTDTNNNLIFKKSDGTLVTIVDTTAVGDGKVLINATDTAAGFLSAKVAGIADSGTDSRVTMIGTVQTTKSVNSTYTATAAGFLVLSFTAGQVDNQGITMDMQSPAGTSISKVGHHSGEFGDTDIRHQGMIPVASGKTYTIITSGSQSYTVESLNFIDIGAA